MVKEFKHQWAIILGGSTGLGCAAALKLAEAGMNVCIVHRNSRSELKTIESEFQKMRSLEVAVLTFNVDVNQPNSVSKVIEAIKIETNGKGKINCLLHSIAKGSLKALLDSKDNQSTTEDFMITIQNMALSLLLWVQTLFQEGMFAEDARILAFTSEGNKKPLKYYAAVSAAKASLEALIRNIALEYGPFGLRANCIQAGITNTKSFQMIPNSEQILDENKIRNPSLRMTQPEDIANVVYLLCKKEAYWINGTTIVADGGESLN